MSRKQLATLFVGYHIIFFYGAALVSLMPVYAQQLGVGASSTGIFLAIVFASIAAGTLIGGTLSSYFDRRKVFIVGGSVINSVLLYSLSAAQTLAALTVIMSLVWFIAGVQISMINILTGMYANKEKRGQTFGLLGVARALSYIVSGLVAGFVVDHFGYGALFALTGLASLGMVFITLGLEDKSIRQAKRKVSGKPNTASLFTLTFILILAASVFAYIAKYVGGIGHTLAMNDLGFDSTAIMSVVAISGVVNLPMPFIIGWFSDRLGRKSLLIICYLGAASGIALMAGASVLWHFWLGEILLTLLLSTQSVGKALITDMVSSRSLDSSLAIFSTMPWIGAVLGYAGGGAAIDALGTSPALIIAATLPVIAALLIASLGRKRIPVYITGEFPAVGTA